ncbi:hypothetical protein SAMN04487931_10550 [Desulfobacula phenolica]|uniref:Uncharacterized protein n=1 Tax=Desulfobacula phenolica TaxID=90732 RepID=A0A1H2G859_9BACT|nr:hypothetical protein SAMN04487931_10550 [Desulfobacula phenolica]
MNKQIEIKQDIKNIKAKKTIVKNTKLFFSKETERKIFFFMTIIMLFFGLISKLV